MFPLLVYPSDTGFIALCHFFFFLSQPWWCLITVQCWVLKLGSWVQSMWLCPLTHLSDPTLSVPLSHVFANPGINPGLILVYISCLFHWTKFPGLLFFPFSPHIKSSVGILIEMTSSHSNWSISSCFYCPLVNILCVFLLDLFIFVTMVNGIFVHFYYNG